MDTLSVLQALKNTSKGKLKYDPDWYTHGRFQQVLQECSSPPKLGIHVSQVSNNDNDNRRKRESREESKNRRNRLSSDEATIYHNHHVADSTETDDTVSEPESEDVPSRQTAPVSLQAARYQKAICNVEDEWSLKVKEAVEKRKRKFEQNEVLLKQAARERLMELYLRQEEEAAQVMVQALEQERARSEEVQQKHLKLKERHRQHAMFIDSQMQEAHRKLREEEEKRKKKLEEARQRLHDMLQMQERLRLGRDRALQALTSCQYQDLLPESVTKYPTLLEKIWNTMEDIIHQAKQSEATPDQLKTVSSMLDKASNIVEHVAGQIEVANKKGKEDAAKQLAEQEKAAADAAAAAAAAAAAQAAKSAAADSGATTTATTDQSQGSGSQFVADDSFLHYMKLQEKLQGAEKAADQLTNDSQYKKLKFELQKAVNTTVNAISPTSGAHLRDKLQRLCRLLSGQALEIGGKTVSAASHPAGVTFCKQLFAKKVVKQGDEQVSSNHDSAFAIAAVTVGVWCEFPDVGDLILAGFHKKCPYTVPYYLPKKDGQNSEDYYRSLGYLYEDNTVEKQDKFLRRMTGLMWLFAAMIISTPPQGQQRPHPHGLEQGWLWLAHVLNLPPRPDITATMLHDFLQVTGHKFQAAYGKQFSKLLHAIHSDFLPKIKGVVPAGAGGPVTRLESFLEKCLRGDPIAPPKGTLPANFWIS